MSIVLGITGGIATGKSTVVNLFKEYGYPVVDGDLVARQVVEKGQPALKKVEEVFGSAIIKSDGTLDRKKLGKIVFADEQSRHLLNQTLKPFLRTEILRQIKVAKEESSLVIADIPLLYEGHYEAEMDQVAVVYIPEKLQLDRLMKRDQLTVEEAQQRITSQLSIEIKKQRADVIFDNQGTVAETRKQVVAWLEKNIFLKEPQMVSVYRIGTDPLGKSPLLVEAADLGLAGMGLSIAGETTTGHFQTLSELREFMAQATFIYCFGDLDKYSYLEMGVALALGKTVYIVNQNPEITKEAIHFTYLEEEIRLISLAELQELSKKAKFL